MSSWELPIEHESWRFSPLQPRDPHGRWSKIGVLGLVGLAAADMFGPHHDDVAALPPLGATEALGHAADPHNIERPIVLGSTKPVNQMSDRQLMGYLKKLRANPWSSWHGDMIRHVRTELYLRGYTTDTKGDIKPKGSPKTHRPGERLVVVPPGTLT